jgi:cytochrome c oxidase subunit 2
MALTALAVTVLAGCGGGRSPSILGGAGSESRSIGRLWWLLFALAAVVYVVVAGFVILAIARGRREGAVAEGENRAGDDRFIWVGGIAMPVVILALIGVVTVTTTQGLRQPQPQALHIHVAGERWWWDVSYPDSGVHTANEIHVPVGQQIDIELTSDNVIHSFWVPELAGKVDVIPGQPNHLQFTVDHAGTYRGQCAEFCGIQHANMAFVVVAEDSTEFGRWLSRRSSGAGDTPSAEAAAQGALVFQAQSCSGCHAVDGTPAHGDVGPNLSDFGARSTIGALTVPNTPENLRRWITNSQSIKPGNLMPPIDLSADDLDKVVTYLESLR